MKKVFIILLGIYFCSAGYTQPASVQFIHNSPDTNLLFVDVWIDTSKVFEGFQFRTATAFEEFPAGDSFEIRIKHINSTDTTAPLFYSSVILDSGETYVGVLNGVYYDSLYSSAPLLDIDFFAGAEKTLPPDGTTEMLFCNGIPDFHIFDLYESQTIGGKVVSDLEYGTFSGYHSLPPGEYWFQPASENGARVYRTYEGTLNAMWDTVPGVVIAGGFTDPEKNAHGPEVGIFLAHPSGGPLLQFIEQRSEMQWIHGSADRALENVMLKVEDMHGITIDLIENFEFTNSTVCKDYLGNAELNVFIFAQDDPDDTLFVKRMHLEPFEYHVTVGAGNISEDGYLFGPGSHAEFDLVTAPASLKKRDNAKISRFFSGITDFPIEIIFTTVGSLPVVLLKGGYAEVTEYKPYPRDSTTMSCGSYPTDFFMFDPVKLGIHNEALIFLALGFADPDANSDGPDTRLYLSLPCVSELIPLPIVDPVFAEDHDKRSSLDISVYPNPADGEIHFDFSEPSEGELFFYNLSGSEIFSRSISGKTTSFHLDNLPSGFYLYRFRTADQVLTGKIKVIE